MSMLKSVYLFIYLFIKYCSTGCVLTQKEIDHLLNENILMQAYIKYTVSYVSIKIPIAAL